MKVAELTKILQGLDPECNVGFSVGRGHDDEYRSNCAKVELVGGDTLYFLDVDRIEFYPEVDCDTSRCEVVLKQTSYSPSSLKETSKLFDDYYIKNEK